MSSAIGLSPQLFKPRLVGGGVLDGVPNVSVSEKILNEPRVGSLIGEGEAASVAQHVRVGNQGQGSGDAVRFQKQIERRFFMRVRFYSQTHDFIQMPLLEAFKDVW
jgi:hypothetical protein